MTQIMSRAMRTADKFVGKLNKRSKLTGQAYLDQHPLTDRQKAFVHNVVHLGMSGRQATKAAGVPESQLPVTTNRLTNNPGVQFAIDIERRNFEKANMMTKKKVMDGFLEAIEMAKIKAEPMVMVAGWREVARMCGYFEPTRHKLEVTVQGEVVIQKLQQLDDHQLLQLADGDADALAGEFQVVEK